MSNLLSASYWDSYLGAQRAGLSTSAAVNYTKQMMPLASQYESQQLNRIGEWDLRRISSEGSVARDLQRMQGDSAKYLSDNQLKGLYNTNQTTYRSTDLSTGRALQGTKYVANQELRGVQDTNRTAYRTADLTSGRELEGTRDTNRTAYRTADLTSGRQLEGVRDTNRTAYQTADLTSGRQLEGVKDTNRTAYNTADLTSGRELEGTKYVADKNLAGIDLTSARNLEGVKYGADRGLEGTKYGFDSQERQIGLAGNEQRQTMSHETDQTLRLRYDARRQISNQHGRFYG